MDSTTTNAARVPAEVPTSGMSRETGLVLYVIAIVALIGTLMLMKPKKAL